LSSLELAPVAELIRQHHERWNGKGYPRGLRGEEIHILSRILAIADAYDAMTSDRPHRPALPPEEALKELKRCAGTQFDPRLVGIFVELLTGKEKRSGENA
ncbi:MAG: HD domain-containing phosphohydrolase, partial [Bacillota bacterium]